MKKFSKLIALVLVLSLVFAFTACGKGGSDDTIKLGILCSLTGNSQTNGGYAQQGAKMAVEEINAAGGINGKQIELTTDDTPATAAFYRSLGFADFADLGCRGFMLD